MRKQATKATKAQINYRIERQRRGEPADFAERHPLLDAVGGSLVLAMFICAVAWSCLEVVVSS